MSARPGFSGAGSDVKVAAHQKICTSVRPVRLRYEWIITMTFFAYICFCEVLASSIFEDLELKNKLLAGRNEKIRCQYSEYKKFRSFFINLWKTFQNFKYGLCCNVTVDMIFLYRFEKGFPAYQSKNFSRILGKYCGNTLIKKKYFMKLPVRYKYF